MVELSDLDVEKDNQKKNNESHEHEELVAQEKVDMDKIITEVGEFGRYQIKTMAFAAILIIFTAFAFLENVFTTARIKTR